MNYFFGFLGIGIGLFAILLLYGLTMLLYFKIRNRHPGSKFIVELLFMISVFLIGVGIKVALEWEMFPEKDALGSVGNFFFMFYSALGSITFGNLPHGLEAGVSDLLLMLYYGSAIYVGLIFVSLIGTRVNYEFYSYLRLLRPKQNIYVFTALTDESITLAESIKQECKKTGKTYLIVFGGPALPPFNGKEALCRRVMANDFCYLTYSVDKKGSIAKILHLNNKNKDDLSCKFMIFAFDSQKHVPEEEKNLNVVIKDMNERKLHPDRLFIEYVILTKRKINYQAYQKTFERSQTILLPDGKKTYINGSTKNLEEAVSDYVDDIIIHSKEKQTIRICAVGLGHNGGIFVSSAVNELGYMLDKKKRKDPLCIVEVFDTEVTFNRMKDEDEIKKNYYAKRSDVDAIRKMVEGKWNEDKDPLLVYNYQQAVCNEGDSSPLMKNCILAHDKKAVDLITVALGNDKETIASVNMICKWMVEDYEGEKPHYLVFAHKAPLTKGWLKINEKKNNVSIEKSSIKQKECYIVKKDGKVCLTIVPAYYASLIASMTLFNEAYEVGRSTGRRIMDNGLIEQLIKEPDRGVSVWAIGFGGTGEAITNELFVQTPGMCGETEKEASKYSRPYVVNAFDVKMSESSEVFRAEHGRQTAGGGYTFFTQEKPKGDDESEKQFVSWADLLAEAEKQSKSAQGMPAPVYAFHTFRENDAELYKMKNDILGKGGRAPDVITIATGDDYRNITYANVIGQWIINQKATEGSEHNYYLVVCIFDQNNNNLLSTYGTFLDKDKKEIKVDNLNVIIVNNLEDVYSFSSYVERRNSAIQKHSTYERLTGNKRAVWAIIKDLCEKITEEQDAFREVGKAFESKLTELAERYCKKYGISVSVPPDGTERDGIEVSKKIATRINALFEKEREESVSDKGTVLDYENSTLWDKASSQGVVSVERFYHCYFWYKISEVIDAFSKEDPNGVLLKKMFGLLEEMIFVEHDRWVRLHLSEGWVYAPKNKEKKLHKCLIPYSRLKHEKKDTLGYDLANVMWALCGYEPKPVENEGKEN